ncbi:hypothetical protein WKI17_03770 [Streptococcus pneumoniae]|uniref:hypothetical protein n=1 Tax=Streptococcus pseudopneumoniae TaxID=257758 RepID=UPI003123EC62
MKIKEQTRKLAAGCPKHCFEVADRTDEVSSKHCFEVVDETDEVSHIYTARRSLRGLKIFSKRIVIITLFIQFTICYNLLLAFS